MPGEQFYAGLTLAAQVRKMMDHHSAHEVRHISQYEAGILDRAAERLAAGVDRAEVRVEFDDQWERLGQLYTTVIVSPYTDLRLQIDSVPIRFPSLATPQVIQKRLRLESLGMSDATPRAAQVGLNTLVRHALEPGVDPARLWADSLQRRSAAVDPTLNGPQNELINRALYQPTVAVEQSPPSFMAVADVLARGAVDDWAALLRDHSSPMHMLSVGGVIILLTVARGPAQGLQRGLRERLYAWSRPRRVEDDETRSAE